MGIQQSVPSAEAFAVLRVMHWIVNFEGSVHLGVDNQGAVDHLRDILKGVFNPSEVKHEDLWIDIASCIRATPADIRVHKVASHDQESFEKHPLKTLQENGKNYADREASYANQFRPHFVETLWRKHREFRELWKTRVVQMTQFRKQSPIKIAAAQVTEIKG